MTPEERRLRATIKSLKAKTDAIRHKVGFVSDDDESGWVAVDDALTAVADFVEARLTFKVEMLESEIERRIQTH